MNLELWGIIYLLLVFNGIQFVAYRIERRKNKTVKDEREFVVQLYGGKSAKSIDRNTFTWHEFIRCPAWKVGQLLHERGEYRINGQARIFLEGEQQ